MSIIDAQVTDVNVDEQVTNVNAVLGSLTDGCI